MIHNLSYITHDNIQWIHKKINYMKHINTQEDFIGWCRMVTQHADAILMESTVIQS